MAELLKVWKSFLTASSVSRRQGVFSAYAKGILPLGREHLQEKHYAQLLGGPILPVTEAPGLAQGNEVILHHSGSLLILREREESALCLVITSCSLDGWMWMQPSHSDGRLGQASRREEETQAEQTDLGTDFNSKSELISTPLSEEILCPFTMMAVL